MVRLRKKEGDGLTRPVIVEFKGDYEKWTVIRNKSDFREMNLHKKFLEQDMSREEREKRREIVQERTAEWERGGGRIEKRN